jgi:predicted nucleic acid-binding protein
MSSFGVSSKSDGLLDTNVLIHSLMVDTHSEECATFLMSLEAGERSARLEPYIVYEMTYVMSRHLKLSKSEIVSILLRIVQWPGIQCDNLLLSGALLRWRDRPGVSFVDALLASQAILNSAAVFTINTKDFEDLEIRIPKPLTSYTP